MKNIVNKPVSMKAFILVISLVLAISVGSVAYAVGQILSMKTWSTVGGQVYAVTGYTSVTKVTIPYAIADDDIVDADATVDLGTGVVAHGNMSIAQGHYILAVQVEFSEDATAGTYTVAVSKMVAGVYALIGSIDCIVTITGGATEQTVSFYYDYGTADVPPTSSLLITVEKTA